MLETKKVLPFWYVDKAYLRFWLSFFRFFLLCYQFIPVSLYVTMSVVYAIQSLLMENDLKMYSFSVLSIVGMMK